MASADSHRNAVRLELAVDPAALPAVRRRLAGRLARARPLSLVWHDGDAGALARRALAVTAWREARQAGWRVEELAPTVPRPYPLGLPMPPVFSAESAAALLAGPAGLDVPAVLVPVLRLDGRVRHATAPGDGLTATLVDGSLGTDGGAVLAGATSLARVTLAGPAAAVAALGHALVAEAGARVPEHSLAGEARLLAGMPVPGRPLGAPHLPEGVAPGMAFALAASHLMGVVLHHAPRAAARVHGEPVHQMRVALRRLRSITGLFAPVVGCPEVEEVRHALKVLATLLGPARDWDVFLDGTGQAVAQAFADAPEMAALVAAAEARRAEAYDRLAEWLAGPALHQLGVRVAVMAQARPWEQHHDPAAAPDIAAFGATVLARHLRRVVRRQDDLATMPEAALHALRLKAKRLRYAAEVFAPLFPERAARRFLRRLADLQEELGLLNDGVVAAELMAALAEDGGQGLAGGMVRGFVAARATGARGRIVRAWQRLRRCPPFWT